MNSSDFIQLTKEPCSINKEQTNAIDDIIESYPYFQTARVIQLKGLKKQHSFRYNNVLKKVAAYTTNRTVLFDFITADTLDFEKKILKENNIIREVDVIDLEVVTKKPVLESLQIGEPLDFDTSEKHSFSEWLQLTSFTPIQRVEKIKETSSKQTVENFELINQFLETKPKIKPLETLTQIDISNESIVENETLMTETLARVYLEQKKYEKAIKAFKILSLKYPEKSGFFADRIKAVKFLQKK